jgi:hypoxanthine phosphoribosyltransferase
LNDKLFPGGNVISYSIMGLNNEGKKILIVDDILDDGDTLAKLFREWGNRKTNLNNIKIFTINYNKYNKHGLVSDFYMYEHNPKFWQVYPWEYDL